MSAWQEGYDACNNGQARNMNPYAATDPLWDEWDNGWSQAQYEAEGREDE